MANRKGSRDETRGTRDSSDRPGFVAGWGGNAEGYGRGGALDYGYGGMNVGGRDRDWGLGDVPHIPQERYGAPWSADREDDVGGGYGEGGFDSRHTDFTGRGPRGYRRSDTRISEDVCDALTDNADLDASGIEVHVETGEVTLGGTVPNRYSKRLAEDVAGSVRGVVDVHNRLTIER